MRVHEIMTVSPHTLAADATLGDAVELMRGYSIRHLPIVDGDKVVGIISDRDVKVALGPDATLDISDADPQMLEGSVDWFMSDTILTIDSEAPISEAGELFLREKYGALPVMRGGKLVGILSVLDILRVALPALQDAS